MSFYITFQNGLILKQMVDICKDLITESNIHILENGLDLQAMDMSHVSLTHFFIDKSNCSNYNISKETLIALSLKNLSLILKAYKETFELSLCKNEHEEFLQVSMYDRKTDEHYNYCLNLMQIDQEQLSIPARENQCEISMNSVNFSDLVKNISIVGESMTIKTVGKLMSFESEGDIGKVVVSKSFTPQTMKTTSNLESNYSLRYISLFIKASSITPHLKITMINEEPLQLRYEMDKNENTFIEFYLAPKLDD